MAGALTEILRAASKHPNSRVSKLIHLVEEERTQKNIVLLLIELADHAEYSIDFNVSLKYYVDLFERLGIDHDLVLNEAGLLLINSSKIYSKRVDYVQSLVERQILTLSNADDELQKQKLEQEQQTENATPVEKPKRGRKRALEAPSNPYEFELVPKKFKKLTPEKRFAAPKSVPKAKSIFRNIEMEEYIHPACWQYATIYDFENEEDVDTKRNYKLFTYHLEHRYNTLVPDINFRLHFKVKDYMDEQEEMEENEACNTDRSWPPLSDEYVKKYLRLENYVLQQDMQGNKKNVIEQEERTRNTEQTDALADNIDSANELERVVNTSNINESTSCNNYMDLEHNTTLASSAVNTTSELSLTNKTQDDSVILNANGENDSGLGQSLLDETSKTLDNTQINCTLETSTNAEDLNSTTTEARKSLNGNKCETGNDSALGISVLDQSGDMESNTTENNSLNFTKSQLENDSALGASVEGGTESLETTKSSSNLDAVIDEKDDPKQLTEATDNGKDSISTDDRHHLISTENLASSTEYLTKIDDESGEKLKIDVIQQQDKNTTQLRVHLPNGEDEGVYLSDMEEQCDSRLLSPVLNITNILPGVQNKDVTIIMDEELRQALEMRDGIMKHFGHETFKVPVITETRKQNLIFNILKLPEKLLRKRILFKLGPEMDVYLKARSLKRSMPEHVTRSGRKSQCLRWFSLKNTDMTGVCMTPAYSPGHDADFCGFSDKQDDSCAEFCGFTEEEQSKLAIKAISRLSRDSGVGVDSNNLTPDKESLEIKFEIKENLVLENGKINLNSDETQSVENILSELPKEIRDVLTTELEVNSANNSTTANKNRAAETETETESNIKLNDDLLSSNKAEDIEKFSTQNNIENSETVLMENCSTNNTQVSSETPEHLTSTNNTKESENSTQNSIFENTENCSPNNTEPSDAVLTETSIQTQTCTAESAINSEPLPTNKSDDVVSDIAGNTETPNNSTALQNTGVDMPTAETSNTEKYNKGAEELLKEKIDLNNSIKQTDDLDYHHGDVGITDSDDYVVLDLNTQGNKTKIQQWHEHLQPILAKSRERHHFDVYKLGSEIIDNVQSKGKIIHEPINELESATASFCNPIATFHDIMDNKDKSYVSRYFLSTLLLANQSNIEISIQNQSSERPSAWQDINLKLLSRKRHTVAIEDNIGMIDSKQRAREQNVKQNLKDIQNETIHNHHGQDSEEDEPLIKLQRIEKSTKKCKTPLKRSISDNATTSCIGDKKSKEISLSTSITNSRHNELPNLIESVQIIKPSFANAPLTIDTSVMPSTSRQAQKINSALFNVNINAIRTLQPIEKVQKIYDDNDSGIFSIDEMSTS